MGNYLVNWTNGSSQENFLVMANSFSSAADIVWVKKSFEGSIQSLYATNLSIDKEMGSNVYYIVMGNGSKFFITSETWFDAKSWVYETLGSDIDTIMSLDRVYVY